MQLFVNIMKIKVLSFHAKAAKIFAKNAKIYNSQLCVLCVFFLCVTLRENIYKIIEFQSDKISK